MIQTVDNYFSFEKDTKQYYFKFEGTDTQIKKTKKIIKNKLEIKLSDYQDERYSNNTFLSFFNDVAKKDLKNQDDLIISIAKDNEDNYKAHVGNYIGKFIENGLVINIKSRFSDIFLKRMLNFANDVYLDTSVFDAQKEKKSNLDYSKFIIYYMFKQRLEKAFLLGLPKAYRSIEHHEMKLKGKIDINRFIKYDIPFKGKVSSVSREQKEIQKIIDVLYKAITIIEKDESKFSLKNIAHIKTHLKQHRSNKYVSNETISKAIKSKALQNPIFASYKKVLEYAKLIINSNNLEEKKDAKEKTFGFLVNVSELFEIYLVKLLRLKMPDWDVKHDRENELTVYEKQFYNRPMYPDIVMTKADKVMVFDAKYKRMNFNKGGGDGAFGDLDRSDFYQIHSYMSYYQNQENPTLIAGGLLYPIETEFNCRFNDEKCDETYDRKKAHSDSWFGNGKVKFIVDGIDLSKKNLTIEDIKFSEDAFIDRIKKISGEN